MLRTLFQWFDAHPQSYWVIAAVITLLWLGCTLLPARVSGNRSAALQSESVFIFLLLAMLVAWRWPFWLNADPYNPDESQFIAGAITLTRDPMFWRSIDGTTSGPLNFYALLPFHWLGLPLDYFSARVTGLLLVWMAILGCYRLVTLLYGSTPARLAVLPVTAFFITATDADFIHYSSEHVPLALIALSAACLFTIGSPPGNRSLVWPGGLLAGMLPWAKLQTTPIAATLVLIGAWNLYQDRTSTATPGKRLILSLVVAALIPSAVIAAVIGASGHITDLYRDYILQNFHYLNQNWALSAALQKLWAFSFETGNFPAYIATALGVVVFASIVSGAHREKNFAAAGLLTFGAILCVIAPKRAFLHYALLTVIPISIWIGVSIGSWWRSATKSSSRRFLTTTLATAAFCLIVGVRLYQGSPKMFGHFAEHWRRPRPALSNIVRALTSQGDRLAVWGWMERIHVDTGLAQATRESKSVPQISPSLQREHYRERYVSDLKKNLPPVFVDATGPGAPVFDDRAASGHETVPALAEFIRANYLFFTDLGYARIYVRPERLRERPVAPPELWRLIAEARRDEDPRGPSAIQPGQLPQKKIRGRLVQMLPPPAELVWDLDGTEREVFLEYGFDPKAYQEGNSNGAEVIVELRPPNAPARLLQNRSLDPVKRVDDRGPLVSRIVLPPFPAGSKLAVRTTPGEFGDNAWDWVYVGSLDCVRAPFYSPSQFPEFARIPHSIVSEYTSLLVTEKEKLLMMHAPTSLEFILTGTERHWQFDYGFQPGAYTRDGQTDGATFSVELKRANQPPAVLFSRRLDPVRVTADQGRLHADVAVREVRAGDQLVMRIEPGPSLAWDWTYITHVHD